MIGLHGENSCVNKDCEMATWGVKEIWDFDTKQRKYVVHMVTVEINPPAGTEVLLPVLMIIALVWGIYKCFGLGTVKQVDPIAARVNLPRAATLGIYTLTVQSKHSQGERNAAIKKFNTATYPVSCMITSMKLSSLGVNFHHACWDGIIVEYSVNMGTQIQALGRL
ncbi:DEAD-like helicase [Fusarium acutatum]|uniref:DEAD-like helicase n=1 Tax=Fusarium acutatum TaxID=78861 RepID=A0A8H4JQF6_9HYPO|nr:DEAD-like helicase [Fusarium acutatum]